jgi:hypothetical protein
MHPSELDEVEAAPRGSVLDATRERWPPIDDVVAATAWWGRSRESPKPAVAAEPYRPSPKAGRNEPCPCGSGKTFKKCCGR